jgi:RNA polymerase sigma factor (sigma-70 family)
VSPRLPISLLAAQPDRRLVELVREGHERAFEVLVHRYRRQLLRYCARMGLSDSRAEDVLQSSLLRAWMALERGAEVRDLRPWLYRIVHNTALNVMRDAREDYDPLSDAGRVEPTTAIESEFERRVAVRDALSGVASLPPMQRDAILLSAVDGHSHEEVASVLGVTHGAVRGLLYRARATLRSAAAAVTPQPLIGWACGCMGRAAPTAQRLAEISSQGATADTSGALLKGAAAVLTGAVLVTGVAVAPLQLHAAHDQRSSPRAARMSAARPTGAVSASIPSPAGVSRASAVLSASTGFARVGDGARSHVRAGHPRTATALSYSPAPGSARAPATTHSVEGDLGSQGGSASSGSSGGQGTGVEGSDTNGSTVQTSTSAPSDGSSQPSPGVSDSEAEKSSGSTGSTDKEAEAVQTPSSGDSSTGTASPALTPDS